MKVCLLLALVSLVRAIPVAAPERKFIDNRPASTLLLTSATLSPWIRTVSGEVELVTPTVIDGITFSASPKSVKTPPPWVSINKDGVAKTIVPKVKGGETKNGAPDYDTWFDTPVTMTHSIAGKGVKGAGDKSIHKEVKYIPEDQTNARLNPLIRCTPDRYFDRRGEKKNSVPFCTPHQNSDILLDQTHWISWYTKYFDEDDTVRLHLAYVEDTGLPIDRKRIKRSADMPDAFFTSEWRKNDGFYPLAIEADWLMGQYQQIVALSIQPESISDDEFDLLGNSTILRIRKGPTVMNNDKAKILELRKSDDGLTMTILALPTCMLAFFCVYTFVIWYTRDARKIGVERVKRKKGYEQLNGQ